MPTPTADTYTASSGATLQGGRGAALIVEPPQVAPYQALPNAMWINSASGDSTYYHDGATYIGFVTGGGTVAISKYTHALGTRTDFALSGTGFSQDDHSSPAIIRRADGRILAFYCRHNDGEGIRYRVSTSADDVSAWGAEQFLTVPGYNLATYQNVLRIPATGQLFLSYRNDNVRVYRISSDEGATWSAAVTLFSDGSNRPYPKFLVTAPNRIDAIVFAGSPGWTDAGVFHYYGIAGVGGIEWKKADGTAMSLPLAPEAGTQVYDGTTNIGMWTAMKVGPDGKLWALLRQYIGLTDANYVIVKLTGSTWGAPIVVANGMHPVLTDPSFWSYLGDACFDSLTASRIYLSNSASTAGPWELSAYDTTDNGATWAKTRSLTSGSASGVKSFRPAEVPGGGPARVAFIAGTYTSLTSFATELKLAA